ncbi:MAG TPA: hypothetical protein VMM76_04835 [Pirellulaceae bacterium]|nr:hypothetical protein [Pirellulaceae bacterium]
MKLTPEQKKELAQARAKGEQRVSMTFTPEQRSEWKAAVAEELASKEENIAHIRKIKTAAEAPGFFGDVRRAIMNSRQPIHALAQQIGTDARQLSDFRAGEAELAAESLDRLIEALGLRLMQKIR